MLTYLSTSTCPDISFAIHQYACFCSAPKHSHELAVRCIARYWKGIRDRGYILKPSSTHHNIDCYVDADFAGLWSPQISSDPISAKSQTGYVITFPSCPVLWTLKLQTEIALHTTEAEHVAMSQAAQDLLPMYDILQGFFKVTKLLVDHNEPYWSQIPPFYRSCS